jgi:hypothetical protein
VSSSAGTRAALATVWWLVVAGVAGGLVWLLVAPRAKIRIDSDGSGYYVDPSPREYIHADLVYTVVVVVVGVAAALLVRRFARAYPVPAVVGLGVGGLLAAITVWQLGKVFAPLDRAAAARAKPGAIILDKLDLGAKGLLLVLPVVALATWLLADFITQRSVEPVSPDVGWEPPPPPSD